ncbi:uncharacterized protein [Eurosta solidaginis]|uniref:uncharacterized protein n=1 Tax=Eurosta solidaginis TaxID=178769 RepID=UPI003530BEEE
MAFMPQFLFDECLRPLFWPTKQNAKSLKPSSTISEVPSEMRMLTSGQLCDTSRTNETIKRLTLASSQRHRKGRLKRRSLHTRVRRIVSCFSSRRPIRFHDVNDIEFSQSEILQRVESFHSLREELNEPTDIDSNRIDACTGTEIDMRDEETETDGACLERKESSVQVDDEMNPERILDCVPSQTRIFLNMLKTSVEQNTSELIEFNKNLLKRWEADKDFRDGLEILQTYSIFDISNNNEQVSARNYEHFVNAMSCLHVLEELFKPLKVPIMQQIEDHINEQLMNFHTNRMESEFYCTVYYPVKREMSQDITNHYENLMANSM